MTIVPIRVHFMCLYLGYYYKRFYYASVVKSILQTLIMYSLRPKVSIICASEEITLTKYIVKNINIYST